MISCFAVPSCGVPGWGTEEGKSKLKTHTFEPESTESLAVWEKLLEQDADHSTPDIHEALLIGECLSLKFQMGSMQQHFIVNLWKH